MTKKRYGLMLVLVALAMAGVFAPASARTQSITDGGTYYGTNVEVGPGETIDGDITVYGGDLIIDGGEVDGNVNLYGGSLVKENGGVFHGHLTDYGGNAWESWLPFAPGATVMQENARLMTRLVYSLIVVLAFLIFPLRVRKALDRVEHHPGLSAAAGVLALVAVVPVAVVLLISVIGWPLIPVEFVAIFALMLIGQGALGVLLGRRLFELVAPRSTPSPLAALVIGLVVLSAAEILPAVGWLVTVLVCLVGLGCAILSFVSEAPGGPFAGFGGFAAAGGPGPAGPRPPIGGPPMTQV